MSRAVSRAAGSDLSWEKQCEFFQTRDVARACVQAVSAGAEHTAVIKRDKVVTFGYGENGRLGHGRPGYSETMIGKEIWFVDPCETVNERFPRLLSSVPPVATVSCGFAHTVLVTKDGGVLAMGSNVFGQLGVGHREDTFEPLPVVGLGDHQVAVAAAGFAHTVLCTATGNVLTCGSGSNGKLGHGNRDDCLVPMVVEALLENIATSVAAGRLHSLVLTLDGIFAFGQDSMGQLGLGRVSGDWADPEPDVFDQPTFVNALGHVLVAAVSTTKDHSVALSGGGEVFTFGNGENGKLGNQSESNELVPYHVAAMDEIVERQGPGKKVIGISAGGSHTVLLTTDGSVYTFGSGEGGQLAHGSWDDELSPKYVAALSSHHIVGCSAGNSHTVFTDKKGSVITVGEASFGQIGHGPPDDFFLPCEIECLRDDASIWKWGV